MEIYSPQNSLLVWPPVSIGRIGAGNVPERNSATALIAFGNDWVAHKTFACFDVNERKLDIQVRADRHTQAGSWPKGVPAIRRG